MAAKELACLVAENWQDWPVGRNNVGPVGGYQSESGCSRIERLRESLSLFGGI